MIHFTVKEYNEFLVRLKDSIFKILPLYEDENAHLTEYIDSLVNYELIGIKDLVHELPSDKWYLKTGATLVSLQEQVLTNNTTQAQVKREVFKMLHLIEKQLKELGEEYDK